MKLFKNNKKKALFLKIKQKNKLKIQEYNFRYTIDYKNTKLLANFLSPQGQILSKKITGLTSKQQRNIAIAIKRGRMGGLLPFINRNLIEI